MTKKDFSNKNNIKNNLNFNFTDSLKKFSLIFNKLTVKIKEVSKFLKICQKLLKKYLKFIKAKIEKTPESS